MSAARALSALLVFSGFVLFGRVRCSRKKLEASQTEALLTDVTAIECRLGALRQPLERLVGSAAEQSAVSGFWTEISKGLSSGKTPSEAFEVAGDRIISSGAREILRELFSEIGSSDLKSELQRLSFAQKRLNALAEETKSRTGSELKLTNSLSVMMGLAAALLLL